VWRNNSEGLIEGNTAASQTSALLDREEREVTQKRTSALMMMSTLHEKRQNQAG
jgi:hypothetical protein